MDIICYLEQPPVYDQQKSLISFFLSLESFYSFSNQQLWIYPSIISSLYLSINTYFILISILKLSIIFIVFIHLFHFIHFYMFFSNFFSYVLKSRLSRSCLVIIFLGIFPADFIFRKKTNLVYEAKIDWFMGCKMFIWSYNEKSISDKSK